MLKQFLFFMWMLSVLWSLSSISYIFLWQGLALNLIFFLIFSLLSKKGGWQFFVSMSTVQKIIPLYMGFLLYKELPASFFWSWDKPIMFLLVLNLLFGFLSALMTFSFFMLMVYSSLSYSSWMLVSLMGGNLFFISFLLVYFFLLWLSFYLLKTNNLYFYKNMSYLFSMDKKMYLLFLLIIVSGFPPTIIFIFKMQMMKLIFINLGYTIMLFFSLMSALGYYYYLRVGLSWSYMGELSMSFLNKNFKANMLLAMVINLSMVLIFVLLNMFNFFIL